MVDYIKTLEGRIFDSLTYRWTVSLSYYQALIDFCIENEFKTETLANKEEFKVKNTAVFIACPVKKKAVKKKQDITDKNEDSISKSKKCKKSKEIIEQKLTEDSDEHEKNEESENE